MTIYQPPPLQTARKCLLTQNYHLYLLFFVFILCLSLCFCLCLYSLSLNFVFILLSMSFKHLHLSFTFSNLNHPPPFIQTQFSPESSSFPPRPCKTEKRFFSTSNDWIQRSSHLPHKISASKTQSSTGNCL